MLKAKVLANCYVVGVVVKFCRCHSHIIRKWFSDAVRQPPSTLSKVYRGLYRKFKENLQNLYYINDDVSSLSVPGCVGVIPPVSESGAQRAERWGRCILKCGDDRKAKITSSLKITWSSPSVVCPKHPNIDFEPMSTYAKMHHVQSKHTLSFCLLSFCLTKEVSPSLTIPVMIVHH